VTTESVAKLPHLPMPLTSFIGRERDLDEIGALLVGGPSRLLTLVGPGGVGKTRLAIEAAARAADCFPDGVWFVDLSSLTDPNLVIPTVAHTLGLTETGETPIADRLFTFMCQRTVLLVLDNLEQVVTAAPELATLLASCSGLVVLVTTREPLAVGGEQEYPVQPLATDLEAEAVRLFAERARAILPGFALTAEIESLLAEICRRLDGLPLAIELAAARIKTLPPHELLARLERRLPVLTGGRRDAPHRQQTMRDTIAWSYDLLSSDEQALFRRLSIFVGGFTLDAAETIAGDLNLDTVDGIASLVDKSLLRRVADETGQARYGMLETVREYALEQLERHGELDIIWLRHAEWVVELAGRLTPLTGPTSIEAITRMAAEHDNALAALTRAVERGDAEIGLRLATGLVDLWTNQSYARGALRWLDELLAMATDQTPVNLLAYGQWEKGWFAAQQGDIATAEHAAQQALAHAAGLSDERIRAVAIEGLGIVASMRGDFDEADARFREAFTIAEAIGSQPIMAGTLCNRGIVAGERGDLAAGMHLLDEALTIGRQLGDPWQLSNTLGNVSWLARQQRDYRRAAAADRERLAIDRAIANHLMLVDSCSMAAGVAIRLGRAERAARLAGASARLRDEVGIAGNSQLQRNWAEIEETIRAALGPESFQREWAAGWAMTREDALADADAVFAEEQAAPDPTSTQPAAGAAVEAGLTPRETEVLRLIARDWSNQQIADALFLSRRTVHKHVENILAKLGTDSRAGAAVWAVRHYLE
jgi:predicted ATPase/DNA-binding CsgD family transcriptional regulator